MESFSPRGDSETIVLSSRLTEYESFPSSESETTAFRCPSGEATVKSSAQTREQVARSKRKRIDLERIDFSALSGAKLRKKKQKPIINKKKGDEMLGGLKKCRTFAAGLEKVV